MSELWFWIITAFMLLISIAIFVVPIYFAKDQNEIASRDALNKAFFRDRMQELNHEEEEGLIQNKADLAVELKQALLDDIVITQNKTSKQSLSALMLLPGVLILIGLSYVTYNIYGSHRDVVIWQETLARLPDLSVKLMSDAQSEMTEQEMNDLTLSLRTQLQRTPKDGMGWLLLGRVALSNRDIQTAVAAMEKSYRLLPGDPDVMIGYAQALMLSGDEGNVGTARELLSKVIKKNHGNLQAFSLLAFEAFERGSFEEAIAAWTTMEKLMPLDDPRRSMIKRSIERAKKQMNVNTGETVSVVISLDPKVTIPQNGVLFVSVHSADGAPMPIAAKKLRLDKFPVHVDLNDQDSMLPERLLSSLSKVLVKARIDSDGNVMTKEGDWFGESLPFAMGESSQIVINQTY